MREDNIGVLFGKVLKQEQIETCFRFTYSCVGGGQLTCMNASTTLESRCPVFTIFIGPKYAHVFLASFSSMSPRGKGVLLPAAGEATMQTALLIVPDSSKELARPNLDKHCTANALSMPFGVSGALPVGGPPKSSGQRHVGLISFRPSHSTPQVVLLTLCLKEPINAIATCSFLDFYSYPFNFINIAQICS